jgi:hypothetical protein
VVGVLKKGETRKKTRKTRIQKQTQNGTKKTSQKVEYVAK